MLTTGLKDEWQNSQIQIRRGDERRKFFSAKKAG